MTPRRLLGFATALLLLGGCHGARRDPRPAPAVALWSITGPDHAQGWLIGTVHALPPGLEWRRPAIDRAMQSADRLVLEIGEPLDAASAGAVLARLAFTPGLPAPSQRLDPGARAALEQAYQRLGLDDSRFHDEESWAVALQIAALAGQRDGLDPGNGIEPQVRSAMQGKPVSGLETIEGQFAIFDHLPAPAQNRLLADVAHDAATGSDDEHDMLALWLKGDDLGMAREAHEGFLADPTLREALLEGRNRAWSGAIDHLLHQGVHPFIAVGAAHVAGPDGLAMMLARKGWTVTRVN